MPHSLLGHLAALAPRVNRAGRLGTPPSGASASSGGDGGGSLCSRPSSRSAELPLLQAVLLQKEVASHLPVSGITTALHEPGFVKTNFPPLLIFRGAPVKGPGNTAASVHLLRATAPSRAERRPAAHLPRAGRESA